VKWYKISVLVLITLLFNIGVKAVTLVDMYKRGEITLVEDPSVGKNTDWEPLLYDYGKNMTIGPDGSFYVAHLIQSFISKFDRNGNFVRNFMQQGQGPLDCINPSDLSILDAKYLVVVDFVENRKITLVDLEHIDSKHVIILKTQNTPWKVTAIKNNKIAYIAIKDKTISKWEQKRIYEVILKNIITGNEVVVARYEYNYKCRESGIRSYFLSQSRWFWKVFLARSNEGNLIVGVSDRPTVDIISTEGEKIKTLTLDCPKVKLSDSERSEIMDKIANSKRIKSKSGSILNSDFKNAISGSTLFGAHLPYYKYLTTDSLGNILIIPNDRCLKDCPIVYRVYSPEGKYIATTKINTGKFKVADSYRLPQILFTDKGIFGIWDLKDAEDIYLRIVKVKIQ